MFVKSHVYHVINHTPNLRISAAAKASIQPLLLHAAQELSFAEFHK